MTFTMEELNRTTYERWIRERVQPVDDVEVAHQRPWSTVIRVPVAEGTVWFKACAKVQAFESQLTASLSTRWPDRVAEVLTYDADRGWMLLADAGSPIRRIGNPPEAWLTLLPRYAELQIGEAAHAEEHLINNVPDLRLGKLPTRFEQLLRSELPIGHDERRALDAFAPQFADLCTELESYGIPASVQHDDLHYSNVYSRDDQLRILDWGDTSISHPFASLVVTFRFLEEFNGLAPSDPWFQRLRDAYLAPWGGGGLERAFALALRIGAFAHALACLRQRDHLKPDDLAEFDRDFSTVLQRAIARIDAQTI